MSVESDKRSGEWKGGTEAGVLEQSQLLKLCSVWSDAPFCNAKPNSDNGATSLEFPSPWVQNPANRVETNDEQQSQMPELAQIKPGPAQEGQGKLSNRMVLPINLSGSLQNPSWMPDGQTVVFNRFRNGYNSDGAVDIYSYNIETGNLTPILNDGAHNVTEPGSSIDANGKIIFSRAANDRDDRIYTINADGSGLKPLPSPSNMMAYEPTFSPDGQSFAFEAHNIDESGHGRIIISRLDGKGGFEQITPEGEDCRQPNWKGDKIIYQRRSEGQWDVWSFDVPTGQSQRITRGRGDKTDATLSADGNWVIYSGESNGATGLFRIPVSGNYSTPELLTAGKGSSAGYDGAPTLHPNGSMVVFEYSKQDPDGGPGTDIVWAR